MREPAARRRLLLAVASFALLVPGPVRADFPEIQMRGTLRVLASADEDPQWFSIRAAAHPGFERELLEGFARLHKLKLEVVPVAQWETAIPELVKGKGDLIAGINDTPARRQQVEFTIEIVPSRHLVVTRQPARAIRSAAELKAARVGVVQGTTWAEAVTAAGVPESQLTTFPDLASCLAALRAGTVSATVVDVVDFLLARRADPQLQDGVSLGSGLSGSWAVRKGDPELRRQLDTYVQNVRKTASWSRLVVQYFGEDALRVLGRDQAP